MKRKRHLKNHTKTMKKEIFKNDWRKHFERKGLLTNEKREGETKT